jgi:copper chaperone CopZ
MKKQLLLGTLMFLLAAFVFTTTAKAQTQDTTIKEVKILTSAVCDHCKSKIEKKVNKLDGIESLELDVTTKILTVKYDSDLVTVAQIKTSITKAGYSADEIPADKDAFNNLPKCCKNKMKNK